MKLTKKQIKEEILRNILEQGAISLITNELDKAYEYYIKKSKELQKCWN